MSQAAEALMVTSILKQSSLKQSTNSNENKSYYIVWFPPISPRSSTHRLPMS